MTTGQSIIYVGSNTGIYAFNSDILCKYLPLIRNNNSQGEYYLTDIIEII